MVTRVCAERFQCAAAVRRDEDGGRQGIVSPKCFNKYKLSLLLYQFYLSDGSLVKCGCVWFVYHCRSLDLTSAWSVKRQL